jgi:hypothetical protein
VETLVVLSIIAIPVALPIPERPNVGKKSRSKAALIASHGSLTGPIF